MTNLGPIECLWHLDHYDGPLNRVLDLGAYHGQFSIGAAKRGAKEVHAIEPDMDNFAAMHDAINDAGLYGVIRIMNIAVTLDGQPVQLYGSGNTSTLLFADAGNPRKVPSIAFKRLLNIMAPLDYLKIDVEGAEHVFFDHSDELAAALMSVRFMEVEIHKVTLNEDMEEKRMNWLIEYLQDSGFNGDPCNVRLVYPGAFCSYNRYFG